jgi:hypothetical protein
LACSALINVIDEGVQDISAVALERLVGHKLRRGFLDGGLDDRCRVVPPESFGLLDQAEPLVQVPQWPFVAETREAAHETAILEPVAKELGLDDLAHGSPVLAAGQRSLKLSVLRQRDGTARVEARCRASQGESKQILHGALPSSADINSDSLSGVDGSALELVPLQIGQSTRPSQKSFLFSVSSLWILTSRSVTGHGPLMTIA